MPICEALTITFRDASIRLERALRELDEVPSSMFRQFPKHVVLSELTGIEAFCEMMARENGDEATLNTYREVMRFGEDGLAFELEEPIDGSKDKFFMGTNGVTYIRRPMGGGVQSLEVFHRSWCHESS